MTQTNRRKQPWSGEWVIRTVVGEGGGGSAAVRITDGPVHAPGNGANDVSDPGVLPVPATGVGRSL